MEFKKTSLEGCFVCEPRLFEDERGYFFEGFNSKLFEEKTGVVFNLSQFNCSKSKKGVLRGLHFQLPPHEQAKLVFVTLGEVLDVAVDLRKNSETYGKYFSVVLSEENKKRLFIPKGFAHGFVTLSESASLSYLVEGNYSLMHDSGIIYNDESIGIDWILPKGEILLSNKDRQLKNILEINNPF